MKKLAYLLLGIFFGIGMFKSGAASWYRIYEMFQFDSFHMYGIMGTALLLGVIATTIIKKKKIKDFSGNPIIFQDKNKSIPRYIIGGILFGLGWALAGACPGPLFAILGAGFLPVIISIVGALLGTWLYGFLRKYLPH
ncbi:YeeE/YedE family protein [Myroides sp. LJL119]